MLWLQGPVFFSSRHCFVERLAAADLEANVLSNHAAAEVLQRILFHTKQTEPQPTDHQSWSWILATLSSGPKDRNEKERGTERNTDYGMQQTEGDRKAKLMNRVLVHSCFLSFVYTATRLLCNSSSSLSSTSSKTTKKLEESTMEEGKKTLWMIARAAQNSLDSNLLASFFKHKAACRYYNISPRQSTKTSHQLLKSLVLKAPSSCTSTLNHKSSYENNSNNNNNHKTMTYWLIFSTLRTTTTGSRDSLSLSPPVPKLFHKATHRRNKNNNNNNQGGIQTRLVPRKKTL